MPKTTNGTAFRIMAEARSSAARPRILRRILKRSRITFERLSRIWLRLPPVVAWIDTEGMLQAMNTGHEGSMATIHANNPREAISRLEQMIGMAGLPMSQLSIRGQISAALRMVVQLQRLADGKRRVTSIAEITGVQGEIIQMQEIFKYVRTGTDGDGNIQGHHVATGVRPRFLQELVAHGINIPGSYFDPSKPL